MEENGSVIRIFEAICANAGCSRAELAQMTDYSLMTVGKAVDALEKGGLIKQDKQPNGSVGRKMSICTVNGECGFLLLDLTRERPTVRIYDMSCGVHGEFTADSDDPCELIPLGFGNFLDTLGGELLGIGCVVPDGETCGYRRIFEESVGNPPEMIVEASEAYSEAISAKLGSEGVSLSVCRFADGSAHCSVRINGSYLRGAGGNAGKRICGGDEKLVGCVCLLCEVLDPSVVHLACEDAHECERIGLMMREELKKCGCDASNLIAEPTEMCGTAIDGAALMLRKRLIIGKVSKNS